MGKLRDEQVEKQLKHKAKNVSEADVHKVLEKEETIERKFGENSPLTKFLKDLELLFAIIKDYVGGEYREVPWFTIAAIVAALLYVLSPIDLIPDFIPGVGYVDDAMVMAVCLKMVQLDLRKYEEWRKAKQLT